MDGTIWIALGLVASIALIVVLIVLKAKKQSAKSKLEMLDTFNRVVAEQKLNISNREMLKDKILAIDEAGETLVFIQNNDTVQYNVIQLASIDDCKIKRMGSTISEKKKNGRSVSEENVNEISLSLISANKHVIDIPFYNELHDGILEKMTLTSIAEKWRDIIRNALLRS